MLFTTELRVEVAREKSRGSRFISALLQFGIWIIRRALKRALLSGSGRADPVTPGVVGWGAARAPRPAKKATAQGAPRGWSLAPLAPGGSTGSGSGGGRVGARETAAASRGDREPENGLFRRPFVGGSRGRALLFSGPGRSCVRGLLFGPARAGRARR
jgi:hypothetical protein